MNAPEAPMSRPAGHGPPGVACTGLTKRFGEVLAVDDVTFEAPMGAVTGFVGANGAGKTTTMRMLLGLVEPTSGTAHVAGKPIVDIPNPRRTLGTVLDTPGAHPGQTGRAHLGILAAVAGVPRRRVEEVLDMVDLQHAAGRRIGGYSLGMRQRLSLAAAMLPDPRILILDEPTKGLDPPGMLWLRDLLRALADEGRCVFVSSHHLSELEAIADQVVVLERGRVAGAGPLHELLRASGSQQVMVRTPGADVLVPALLAAGAQVKECDDGQLAVVGLSEAAVGDLAASTGVALHHLAARVSELEDVFLELTDRTALAETGSTVS